MEYATAARTGVLFGRRFDHKGDTTTALAIAVAHHYVKRKKYVVRPSLVVTNLNPGKHKYQMTKIEGITNIFRVTSISISKSGRSQVCRFELGV
jgi:hypothetical protein